MRAGWVVVRRVGSGARCALSDESHPFAPCALDVFSDFNLGQ